MKQLVILAVGVFFTLTATAQSGEEIVASGNTIKSKRTVPDFENIIVSGPFEVILDSGNTGTLTIEASDNIAPLIFTEVNNKTLTIWVNKDIQFKPSQDNKVTIRVPFTVLNGIALNGSGSITSHKTIACNILLNLAGSGSMALTLRSPKTEAYVTGSGSIELNGTADHFNCAVIGSGSIKATELESDNVEAAVKGSGSLRVLSNKNIKGRISGCGSIAFGGEPTERDLIKTGSGEFKTF